MLRCAAICVAPGGTQWAVRVRLPPAHLWAPMPGAARPCMGQPTHAWGSAPVRVHAAHLHALLKRLGSNELVSGPLGATAASKDCHASASSAERWSASAAEAISAQHTHTTAATHPRRRAMTDNGGAPRARLLPRSTGPCMWGTGGSSVSNAWGGVRPGGGSRYCTRSRMRLLPAAPWHRGVRVGSALRRQRPAWGCAAHQLCSAAVCRRTRAAPVTTRSSTLLASTRRCASVRGTAPRAHHARARSRASRATRRSAAAPADEAVWRKCRAVCALLLDRCRAAARCQAELPLPL